MGKFKDQATERRNKIKELYLAGEHSPAKLAELTDTPFPATSAIIRRLRAANEIPEVTEEDKRKRYEEKANVRKEGESALDYKKAATEKRRLVKEAYLAGEHSPVGISKVTGVNLTSTHAILRSLREKKEIGEATEEDKKRLASSRSGLRQATLDMINEMVLLLKEIHPQTIRQIFYGLVVKGLIENTKNEYTNVSHWGTKGRLGGYIPWEYIEDRTREPQSLNMFNDLEHFAFNVSGWYRSNWWAEQEKRIVFWCEKDALSGIIWPIVKDYGVSLYVGKGYDSWSSIKDAAEELGTGEDVIILYAGDLDAAGIYIKESLEKRLAHLGCHPEIIRIALNPEQLSINNWHIQKSYIKRPIIQVDADGEEVALTSGQKGANTRADEFQEMMRAYFPDEDGDVSVELDAIPPLCLRDLIIEEIESRMDVPALRAAQKRDICVQEKAREAIKAIECDETEEIRDRIENEISMCEN